MRFAPVVACLAMTVLVQGCVSPPEPPAGNRSHVDVDGDGIVTREEAQASPRLASHFDAVDTDGDGRLVGAEIDAGRESVRREARAVIRARWAAADKDGDGAISLSEANESMPGLAKRFGEYDVNGDGKVALDEIHNFDMQP